MAKLSKILDEAKQAKNGTLEARVIVEKIYTGYLEEDEVWRQKRSFAPSSLFYQSGTCAKRWFLSFTGGNFESKTTALSIAGMRNGIDSHARIQAAMKKAGIAKDIEVKVIYDDPPIFGFADVILEHGGRIYVGEIKTTTHKNFEYRRTTNKIADYHLAQMLIYMYVLEIDNGVVIYESKDTNELHAITFEMTDEYRNLVEEILAWMKKVYKLYKDGTMPKRSYRKGSKVCKGCPVEKLCDVEDGDIPVERLNFVL